MALRVNFPTGVALPIFPQGHAAAPGAVARQPVHGAPTASPPASEGRRRMTIQSAVPLLLAAASVATSVAAPEPAVVVGAPWWTPMFGPLVTVMSGLVSYAVATAMLKARTDAMEQRLSRIEPKLDDISDRLARMEGHLGK